MDEVENPALPAAGEASPTIKPLAEDDGPAESDPLSATQHQASFKDTSQLLLESDDPARPQQPQRQPGGTPFPGPPPRQAIPIRPTLKREASAPHHANQPPSQPPPPAPPIAENGGFPSEPPDSLTLADLKRIRSSFPNALGGEEVRKQQLQAGEKVYDFEYQDAQSFPAEVEEWFGLGEGERGRLRGVREVFQERVGEEGTRWVEMGEARRLEILAGWVEELGSDGLGERQGLTLALMALVYLALGVWGETGGRDGVGALEGMFDGGMEGGGRLREYRTSSLQIQWMVRDVLDIHACGGLKSVYAVLQTTCEQSFEQSVADPNASLKNEGQTKRPDESMELWCCLTLMYLFIEVARTLAGDDGRALKEDLIQMEPNLLTYFTQVVAKLRWDDNAPIPLTKMLLLSWKTILVTIGGISDVDAVKKSLEDNDEDDEKDARGQPIITASPLDYHLFRQEISSKYPAYQPPPPLFPLEPENNSILPPLKHRRPSRTPSETGSVSTGLPSIMHQPVHIATPAPSPPPSPAGPGKAGKKQNYQTNQMFPFLYPPLDASSNDLGGKGSTELQDALVGRKWDGADIPSSILEAAELFARRMRATRGMRQLWSARVEYMRFERGWRGDHEKDGESDGNEEEKVVGDGFELVEKKGEAESAENGRGEHQTEEERRLNAVNRFYEASLPYLQSLVIVLLKAVLQNVTDLVTKGNGQNGLQAGIQFNEPPPNINSAKPVENGTGHFTDGIDPTTSNAELGKLRAQEIGSKALSAILLLLLKWFKVSHVLSYEYLTQLLLDSNYVPLILKLWQTQEIGRACHFHLEREGDGFFSWCRRGVSDGKDEEQEDEGEESEDEAVPPPIRRNRESSSALVDNHTGNPMSPTSSPQHPPEIDELGYPTSPLPSTPIASYSWRNIFTGINHLRTLQKITRRKTHRALLLVSYKSSTHLKKTLRIPVWPLRYYTLKLFKSQVPFCGRKWRQGNMKIITAVWLSVPAELRDDWLSGGGGGMGGACVGDVDGTVEDALPLEQSLRSLTHWWNLRNYADAMGVDKAMVEEEVDFFARELEKMEAVRGVDALDPDGLEDEGVEGDGDVGVGVGLTVGSAGQGWQGAAIEGY